VSVTRKRLSQSVSFFAVPPRDEETSFLTSACLFGFVTTTSQFYRDLGARWARQTQRSRQPLTRIRMRDGLGATSKAGMRHVTHYGSRFARFGKYSMLLYSWDIHCSQPGISARPAIGVACLPMMALWSPLKCGEWTRVGIGQRRWAYGMGRPVKSRGGCVASCMEISSHSTSSPFLTRARPPPRVVTIL
jgi:hypothetical protein